MSLDPIATIRCYTDLVEAMRAAKDKRELSNKTVEELIGIASGALNRVIGPAPERAMSMRLLDNLMQVFAVRFIMVDDVEFARVMEPRWEKRRGNYRDKKYRYVPGRVSQDIVERAKPHVLREIGRLGGLKAASLPSALKARRKGGRARARKLTKEQRKAIARQGGLARAAAQRRSPSLAENSSSSCSPVDPAQPISGELARDTGELGNIGGSR